MTTPTTPIVVSRMDTIKAELLETYAVKFQEASALGAKGDTAGMSKAIMEISSEIETKARARMVTEKATADALAETEKAGRVALETHAQDVFSGPFEAIRQGFEALQTVGQVIIRIEKDAAHKATMTVLVGSLTKVAGGNGSGRSGPRNHKLTVTKKGTTEAVQYDTVALAWKSVMGAIDQPTQTIGKGTDAKASKTRLVAVEAMVAAGHTVAD